MIEEHQAEWEAWNLDRIKIEDACESGKDDGRCSVIAKIALRLHLLKEPTYTH